MDSRVKILIGVLVVGIVLIGGLLIWNKLTPETKVIGDEKYCEKDTDCHWMCGCGCINKNAKCETPEGIMYDCYPGMEEKYSCVCKDNQCETIEKQVVKKLKALATLAPYRSLGAIALGQQS